MENLQFDFFAGISGLIILFGLFFLCRLAMVLKWLTLSGSIAAFFMALILLWSGWVNFILPLVLFIGGTLLSKLNNDEDGKEGRNAFQVLANGGVGVVCLLCFHNTGTSGILFYIGFLISFSVSICDTFSSETGRYFNGRTIDILTLKPLQRGLSGAVSIEGTLGGLAGVLISAILSYSCLEMSFKWSALAAVFGFSGMLLDSLLGSKFQAKYINATGELEEQKSAENKLCSGYSWCTNNTVNIMSNAIMVAIFMLMKITGLL